MLWNRPAVVAFGFLFLFFGSLHAELQIQLKVLNEATKISVETEGFPVYYSYAKAFSDGNFVVLSKDEVVVVQDNIPRRPFEVSAPDAQNWQKVSWYAAASEYPSVEFYAANNGEAAMTKGNLIDKGMNVLVFKDDVYGELFELDFGTVKPGGDSYRMIQMNIARSVLVDGVEQPIILDSVVVPKPFSYDWLGASINQKEPPVKMEPGFVYRFFGYFKPHDDKYYRDKVTVYFNGKSSETLDIWGNHFDIPTPTMLQLVQPDGGQILAPCTEYEIKWKGQVKGLPTRIDYTTNGGVTWKLIGYSFDSAYVWKIPLEPSTKVKIRVTQEFNKSSVYGLIKDYSPINRLVYDNTGYNILAANDAGFVREWEIYDKVSSEKYVVSPGSNYPGVRTKAAGLEYFHNDSSFVVAFNYVSQGRVSKGELAFFRKNIYSPYKTVQIPDKFVAKEMFINNTRTQLILIPATGSKILIYDIQTGSLINAVDLGKPISAFAFSRKNNEAAVAFYDSEILLLDGTDFSAKKSFYFSNLPVVIELALSPNGKYIGIACRAPVWQSSFRSNRTENHVLDIESGLIVRTNRNSASDALGIEFNPISSSLLIGSEAQPQVAVWDLTGNEYITSLDGHSNVMTDFKVSPDGHSIVTCAAAPDNLLVRFFTYPEHDESAEFLEIGEPMYSLDSIDIEPKYISTSNDYDFNSKLCNTGKVPIILQNASFRFGSHFRLKENIYPDTLMPGQCKEIPLVYNPRDTGAIYDVLSYNTCLGQIEIPIRSRSLPRNITFSSNPFDFGEKCVWQTLEKDIIFIKNNDPVPLKLNNVFMEKGPNSSFRVLTNVRDSIVPPGAVFAVRIAFTPTKLEENTDNVHLYHSDQAILIEKGAFKGWGIGTNLDISHTNLRFIPEIPERKIRIKNVNNNKVVLESYKFTPEGIYSVTNQFPIELAPQEEIELHIRWNTGTEDAILDLTATPCVATLGITCGQYSSQAFIKAGNVEADPRGAASIPIESAINEPKPYKGVRFLEAEFSINPRIFLPEKVTTLYGTAELIKNSIVDDKRIIGVRINGDFPSNGVIGQIEGIAGLAETDTSSIDISAGSKFFGSNTTVAFQPGFFRLINLCGERRIIQPEANLLIKSIMPNPVSDAFTLEFSSVNSGIAVIGIYDVLGARASGIEDFGVISGDNRLNVETGTLKTGTYKLVVSLGQDVCSENIIIIR